jgi:hypothetical protein
MIVAARQALFCRVEVYLSRALLAALQYEVRENDQLP